MEGYWRWLGGGFGWALTGPIGAILGYGLGYALDAYLDTSGKAQDREDELRGYSEEMLANKKRETLLADFKASLLVLIAYIVKIDGKVQKSEIEVVKKVLIKNYGIQGAQDALNILKKILEKPIDGIAAAKQIQQYMVRYEKQQLLYFLIDIAYADNFLHDKEWEAIRNIAAIFKITPSELEGYLARFRQEEDANWAYKVLEIPINASSAEIKKAYKRMAIKYHPDKVAHLGEEAKKIATERFKVINEAYDSLKKEKEFS